MVKRVKKVGEWWGENTSYKLVSLFVAGILWVTMLGNKEVVLAKELGLNFSLSKTQVMTNQVQQWVRVEVRGHRMGVKKFAETQDNLILDLTNLSPGRQSVRITKGSLSLPRGVKIHSIYPEEVVVQLREVDAQK